jgi:hypothetical protein
LHSITVFIKAVIDNKPHFQTSVPALTSPKDIIFLFVFRRAVCEIIILYRKTDVSVCQLTKTDLHIINLSLYVHNSLQNLYLTKQNMINKG